MKDRLMLNFPKPNLKGKTIDEIDLFSDDDLFSATRVRIAFTGRHTGAKPEWDLDLAREHGIVWNYSAQNRKKLIDALTKDVGGFVQMFNPIQVHGDEIFHVKDNYLPRDGVEADGMICTTKNVACMLLFADCCPVILVADNGKFAVIHAGWRGVVNQISKKALCQMIDGFGCDINNINAYIGPHIGKCCFEVAGDVEQQFRDAFGADVVDKSGDNAHIDMSLALKVQLCEAGLQEDRFLDLDICTCCNHDNFFSYRKGDTERGRQTCIAFKC